MAQGHFLKKNQLFDIRRSIRTREERVLFLFCVLVSHSKHIVSYMISSCHHVAVIMNAVIPTAKRVSSVWLRSDWPSN